MAAVQKGIGRETAHEIISEHARKSSMSRREGLNNQSFVELLDSDDRFPLKEQEINELFSQREILIGNASNQLLPEYTIAQTLKKLINTRHCLS